MASPFRQLKTGESMRSDSLRELSLHSAGQHFESNPLNIS